MTPTMDSGFLLIEFFVITADLFLSKEGIDRPVSESALLTLILGKAPTAYWYEGTQEDAIAHEKIFKTCFFNTAKVCDKKFAANRMRRIGILLSKTEEMNGC